jgi:hypothetical protein
MKVSQLILALSQYDPNMEVARLIPENQFKPITNVWVDYAVAENGKLYESNESETKNQVVLLS